MLRALALGLGVGAGIQAWRNIPPDGPTGYQAAAVVFGVGLLAAFFGGLWWGRGGARATATATATATAEAQSAALSQAQVNLYVNTDGARSFSGAPRAGAARAVYPDGSESWMDGPRPQLTVDDLDGADVSDLLSTEVLDSG